MQLTELRQKLEHKKGKASQITDDLSLCQKRIQTTKKEITFTEKAQAIIIVVAKLTQEELEYRITEPVSLALAAVFDSPYKMSAKFDITGRGVTECHLEFEREGVFKIPFDSSGGGPIDIASFALRIGALSLETPKCRRVLIADEPFRFISREKMPLVRQLLKEVSKQLNIQIIMITHIKELITGGDKIFTVSIDKGISIVKEMQNIEED